MLEWFSKLYTKRPPVSDCDLWKREEITTLLDFHDVHTDIAGMDMKTSCCSYLISRKYV